MRAIAGCPQGPAVSQRALRFRPRNRLLRHPVDGIVGIIGASVPVRSTQPIARLAVCIAEHRRRIARRLQRRHAVHLVVSRSDRCARMALSRKLGYGIPVRETRALVCPALVGHKHALAVVVILTYPRGGASRSTVKAPVERGDSLDQVTGSGVLQSTFRTIASPR